MPSPVTEKRSSLLARLGPRGGRLGLISAIAGGVVVLDQVTKAIALHNLSGQRPTELLGGLIRFDLYRNHAGPNNILPGHTELISIVAILAVVILLAVGYRVVTTPGALVVGLMLGGAIGNLLDRLLRDPGGLRGGVIDWLRFTDRTQSMNLADLAIDAAIVVMVLGAFLGWWRSGREEAESSPGNRDGALSTGGGE